MKVLICCMCDDAMSYIDTRGYRYCGHHGKRRRLQEGSCRPLTTEERRTLHKGQTIVYGEES